MYVLKQIPEDFKVKELIKLKKKKNGTYSYFLVKKKDWNAFGIINEIARRLGINSRDVRYAGLKDKRAVTEQYISIKGVKKINFKIKNVEIKKVGEGEQPIRLGGLDGNDFRIVVRDLDEKRILKPGKLVNYFDKQRFSGKNVSMGKALLKRDYQSLCNLLDLKNKDELFNFDQRILRFALNSFQSYIFNKAVKEYLSKTKTKSGSLPLINFDTKFRNKAIEKIYTKLLDEEKIKKENFLFREMPFLVSEGSERKIFVSIKNFKYKYGKDELNKNKLKCTLWFRLPKGSYGTLVVKKLFS